MPTVPPSGDALLAAALDCASHGWPVLALRPGRKDPLTSHGLHDASTDPAQIRDWWHLMQANVGLRTGVGFDVLDIDSPDAFEHLVEHVGNPDLIPGTYTVRTAKGWHLYFEPTGHGNRCGLLPGIDYRGANGYVVAPPSIHPSGHIYRVSSDLPIAEPPTWLLRLLEPPARTHGPRGPIRVADRWARAALEGELDALSGAPVGQRNYQLNRSAFKLGQLVAADRLAMVEVIGALTEVARSIGLGEHEITRTIDSGITDGMHYPR